MDKIDKINYIKNNSHYNLDYNISNINNDELFIIKSFLELILEDGYNYDLEKLKQIELNYKRCKLAIMMEKKGNEYKEYNNMKYKDNFFSASFASLLLMPELSFITPYYDSTFAHLSAVCNSIYLIIITIANINNKKIINGEIDDMKCKMDELKETDTIFFDEDYMIEILDNFKEQLIVVNREILKRNIDNCDNKYTKFIRTYKN